MSDSAALEFTIDNQISRTFQSVDLSQLVLPVEKDLRSYRSSTATSLKIYFVNLKLTQVFTTESSVE